jgi:Plavaka transposase
MIYSDETTLTQDWKQKAYPVSGSLANIDLSNRSKEHGHQLFALLPILKPGRHGTKKELKNKIRRVHQKCMHILTQSVKKASFE